MKAITVSVDYADYLALTLPVTSRHFKEVLVVTSPDDAATQRVASSGFPNVRTHLTDAFYRDGADFNKGLALEEGFDVLGREGWIAVIDADIMLPVNGMRCVPRTPGNLYSAHRRQASPERMEATDWSRFPMVRDPINTGYFHLFHASDPALQERPWYPTRWRHAGGCDTEFEAKWPGRAKTWLPFDVLHLGPVRANWYGRTTERLDGTRPVEAADRKNRLQKMIRARQSGNYSAEVLSGPGRLIYDRVPKK